MAEPGQARRRVGTSAAVLLGAALGHDLAWHVARGELSGPLWTIAGLAAAAGGVVAVVSHRSDGPRRDLRACLVVCVVALALLVLGEALTVAPDDAARLSLRW